MTQKDYFSILEIKSNSTESEIRTAYRKLAMRYHPDINKSPNAQEKFIEITEAYEYLINRLNYATSPGNEKHSDENRRKEEYERFRQASREKAKQHARMRYEEYKKQHEAFQISGINDIALLFKIIIRMLAIPVCLFLIILPVYIALKNEFIMILLIFLTWPFAGIIAWQVYSNRKNYFLPGKFYYSFEKIKQIYTEINPTGHECYYSPSRNANSKPFKLELLRLKEVKVNSGGFRQHSVIYRNDVKIILIPRSHYAFIIHSISCLIKIASVIFCLLFLGISSIIWRFIIGMAAGGIISCFVHLITGIKSNVTYLISIGLLIRVSAWLFFVILVSGFNLHPFNISTSDYIYFTVIAIIVFDCFLMQITDMVLGKYSSKPITRQYSEVEEQFRLGYKSYNDIPVISFVYPVVRWISG